jgi:DNA-binding beta-propeller fold protein YncE
MRRSMRKRDVLIGTGFMVVLIALGIGQLLLDETAAAQQTGVEAPMFEVDPLWPKPLPNHWILGSTIGVTVDPQDHVWVFHRYNTWNESNEISAATDPPTAAECCVPAPPVLEFDPEGNLVNHWGGPGEGYEWPEANHGIAMDPSGNIWLGGNGQGDSQILIFTRDGKFLKQLGHQKARLTGQNPQGRPIYRGNSHDDVSFGRVAKVTFDPPTNEAYVADGYLNKRVVVLDITTGERKRQWGAYGNDPDDTDLGPYDPNVPPVKQFRNPVHCAMPTHDRLLYVCDRVNDRIQVFQLDGTFVKELLVAKETLGSGSVWDIDFSKDPEQKYIYLTDGKNEKVYIIDRQKMEILTSFGDGGRQPGQFYGVHSIAVDSKGNIYTTETYEGKRIQKFVYKGIGPVTKKDQGTVWPSTD